MRFYEIVRSAISILAFMIVVMLAATVAVNGQKTPEREWQTYEPDKALFSMKVPGIPSTAQGHIFDPEDEAKAYKFFDGGLRSRIFNFEIVKGTTRSFLVSILYIQTKPSAKPEPISRKVADNINMTIGDEIIRSKIENVSTKDGTISKWTYGRQVGSKVEDRGRVFVKRSKKSLVVVVVDYDYVEPSDPEIDTMLNSLSVRNP
jgi:hypothetical protein